ncbi:MAG: thiamine phosphate synthase [Actinomycetota bacterium]|nr:thiamine phosphate synthase [Actinomycetota bacterium]
MRRVELGLYVITCRDPGRGIDHLDVARAALRGGADAVQLRDKEAGGRELLRLAGEVASLVRAAGRGCLFLVNDRVDVALACEAHGVHVGQDDLPPAAARRLVGEDMVLGVSAGTVEEALEARAAGADYIGVGPVFATPTKPDAGEPVGIEGLRRIREAVDLPLVAIGGIDASNAARVLEAGADGIAVISAVSAADNMEMAVERLRGIVDAHRVGR